MDQVIPSEVSVPVLVDELGQIRAAIADLEAQEKAVKAKLLDELGPDGVAEGFLFRVKISAVERNTVAWKAIAERFEPSRQLITANTTTSTSFRFDTSSRNGKGV